MKGYYLFRGDTLIAYREPEGGIATAHRLHEQGQEGDVLIHFYEDKTGCFDWAIRAHKARWDNGRSIIDDKYKALILLQK